MKSTRRELIKGLGALGLLGFLGPGQAKTVRPIPWRNWSGAQSCLPAARIAPATEAQLAEALRNTTGAVRPVGAGHSFSALVPTDDTVLSLGNLHGMLRHDAQTLQSEWWGGTPMSQMGAPLAQAGLALPNMADIDYQTLAGAIATSTHGTGPRFGSYSDQVVGLRLLTASGDAIDCDAQRYPHVFDAARCSLGALGVVTRIRLQNRTAFKLHRREWVQRYEELLEDMPRLLREHDHFEMNVLLHSDVAVAMTMDETADPRVLSKQPGGDVDKVALLQRVHLEWRNSPRVHARMLNFLVKYAVSFPDVIDASCKVFANVRDVRFNEMEYEVPAEAGPACLREIMKKIRDEKLDSFFPIEYRYVKRDNAMLSMFQGRDACAISVHQYYRMDHHDFFARIEPVFWKYDGRPHWGKLHTLNARLLAPLYPRWKEFLAVREALDPAGKFLNAHLRSVLGVG